MGNGRRKNRKKPDSFVPLQEAYKFSNDWSDYSPSYIPKFKPSEEFVEAKIKMLRDEFYINLTLDDIVYLQQFKTEGEINAGVRTIINKYWR